MSITCHETDFEYKEFYKHDSAIIPARCCAYENNVNADFEPQRSPTFITGNGNPGERWTSDRPIRRKISTQVLICGYLVAQAAVRQRAKGLGAFGAAILLRSGTALPAAGRHGAEIGNSRENGCCWQGEIGTLSGWSHECCRPAAQRQLVQISD